MEQANILIAGVGGQGILLSGKLLGNYAQIKGKDIKVSEVHGMAQRGGGVVTNVRFGDRVYAPLVEEGSCDALISFEPLETLRWIHYVRPEGIVVSAVERILPLPVAMGNAVYPDDVLEQIRVRFPDALLIDTKEATEKIGNPRTMNVILMGAFAKKVGLDLAAMEEALRLSIKPKLLDINIQALELGYALAQQ